MSSWTPMREHFFLSIAKVQEVDPEGALGLLQTILSLVLCRGVLELHSYSPTAEDLGVDLVGVAGPQLLASKSSLSRG